MSIRNVPAGTKGVTIDASADKPKEITPEGDVHLTPTPPPGLFVNTEGLGAGNTRLLTSKTRVQSLDAPTRVRVKRVRDRSHGAS